ncbi:MAG: helix-turn-helix domain-containing protein [Myxococcota bacterium]|nr:helix-turn-helix domain-containing protein [Myxococcota bacterium]
MKAGLTLSRLRREAGLTQAQLAEGAGVSRALVSAIEGGRHLPRVDAALAIARILGVSGEFLFGAPATGAVDALSGLPPEEGTALRVAFVGEQAVTAPPQHSDAGWQAVDWMSNDEGIGLDLHRSPALVVAGCEPSLALTEQLMGRPDLKVMAISSTTEQALAALNAGRVHLAAVHFQGGAVPPIPTGGVKRIRLGQWRVGLATGTRRPGRWWEAVLAGESDVIQRAPNAHAQQAFERARRAFRTDDSRHLSLPPLAGPRVPSHLAASRRCMTSALAAVTIEPAARAVGADFHALETHQVEFWIRPEFCKEAPLVRFAELLQSADFRRTLEHVGGYELDGIGTRVP